MYLHIRTTPGGGSIVATLRESYREGGRVLKRQHHLGSCPTDKGWGVTTYRVNEFWNSFDRRLQRLSVSSKDRREYRRRMIAAGVPKRRRVKVRKKAT